VEVLKFICADPRYNTVPVITLSTNSVIDTAEEYVLERANKRLIKSSCTPAIMVQAVQELLADPRGPRDAPPANRSASIQIAKTKTIVFVEDNPVVLAAYRNHLQREGFNIEPAPDGLTAMKILSRLVPDVVILDLMLPKFNGVDVLKFIRSNPCLKAVAVIILSTNSIIDTAEEYVLERANKRLLKGSCTPAIMLQAIQELLADPSASTANQSDGSQPAELKTGNVLADIKVTL
jgi:CheY-like chemotaxis protein